MQRDLYLALGVTRSENASGIRAAFRDLARRYHPDRTGPGGAETFREIVDAYTVLSDPAARARYDATLDRSRPARSTMKAARRTIDLRDAASIRPGIEPLFARIATNFTGLGVPKGERLEQLRLDVHLAEEEAATGVVVHVGMPVFKRCSACGGLGGTILLRCACCYGEGLVEATRRIPVHIPPGIADGTELFIPLAQLGIHNFHVCVRVTVEAAAE